jgi:hypothetical protein
MKNDLLDVSFVADAATVADICADVAPEGSLLVCNGCGNIEEPIAGILVIDDDQEAWALCGGCIRKLPLEGTVAWVPTLPRWLLMA